MKTNEQIPSSKNSNHSRPRCIIHQWQMPCQSLHALISWQKQAKQWKCKTSNLPCKVFNCNNQKSNANKEESSCSIKTQIIVQKKPSKEQWETTFKTKNICKALIIMKCKPWCYQSWWEKVSHWQKLTSCAHAYNKHLLQAEKNKNTQRKKVNRWWFRSKPIYPHSKKVQILLLDGDSIENFTHPTNMACHDWTTNIKTQKWAKFSLGPA